MSSECHVKCTTASYNANNCQLISSLIDKRHRSPLSTPALDSRWAQLKCRPFNGWCQMQLEPLGADDRQLGRRTDPVGAGGYKNVTTNCWNLKEESCATRERWRHVEIFGVAKKAHDGSAPTMGPPPWWVRPHGGFASTMGWPPRWVRPHGGFASTMGSEEPPWCPLTSGVHNCTC